MNELNEQQLAELLADHIDGLLAGQAGPEPDPAELAELMPVARGLAGAAPVPRPEFTTALRASLVGSAAGSSGGMGAAGSTAMKPLLLVIVAGLAVLAVTVSLLLGRPLFNAARAAIFGDPSPSTRPAPAQSQPAQLASPTVPPTATGPATPEQTVRPRPTATVILDVLPPIPTSADAPEELPPAPALVPGSAGEEDDGGGGGGDHNRGHGNENDGHDEDNPGHHGHN